MPSSCYTHSGDCKPSWEQYHFQAKKAGKLVLKESEKMNDLLTILNFSDWKMDNSTLRGHLSLVNPSRSYVTVDELRNFRMWARKEYLKREKCKKPLVLNEKDLDLMFDDVIAKPDSSIAVEQAEQLYRNLLIETQWRVAAIRGEFMLT